ncbi:hypothetical protein DBZ36_19470 [Alginatibacterium sediminis]|uniref:XRE family transcriptional regulator n=1 Tax=Alginatibacterium sediminis TaxID=2164068 RepID=A0A420E6C6_9ALTE|nr:hypothetical protein [Alginatibacterium sediminis]RKF13240.1 hypothetical protein DBZ36_19470 [Alginatibacterium sediminis]
MAAIIPINGKQFSRKMRQQGIPASILAMRCSCPIDKIYAAQKLDRVPRRYIEALQQLAV